LWTREAILHRFFSTFPGGTPGFGLLLVRGAVGVTAILHGGGLLTANPNPSLAGWVAALVSVASGASLLAGFLTPIAGSAILAGALGAVFANRLESALTPVLIVVLAAAVILLGPGALSFDARMFGRREIIIPRSPHSPKF
jgi:uncharacterized membrane protein YphA (DoxX/SURF4 family)